MEHFIKFWAVAILFFDPVYWIWEARTFGSLNFATTLPLYLCSLFWMLLPVAAFAKPGLLKRIALSNICTIGILCGIFGIVFNVYLNVHHFLSFVPLRSLLYHLIMVFVPSLLWASGYYRPKALDSLLCFIPIAVLLIPCLLLNRLFGWDYCYTAGGIGTPLEHLSSHLPRSIFLIILFLGLLLINWLIFYCKSTRKFEINNFISNFLV